MPTKSKAQYKFMKSVENGSIKVKGLSKKEAKEFTEGQNPKNLPHKVKNKDKSGRPDIHCSSHEDKACSDRRGSNMRYAKRKWKP